MFQQDFILFNKVLLYVLFLKNVMNTPFHFDKKIMNLRTSRSSQNVRYIE